MQSKIHKKGITDTTKMLPRCKKEVILDKRRVDVQCQVNGEKVNIEVKRNLKDYSTVRSQNQIHDMTKSANKGKQAQITMLAKPRCFIGENNAGKKIIQSKKLTTCKMILA